MYSCPPTRLSSNSTYTSTAMDQGERRNLNSELWHACAGPLVSLPSVGTRVVYFPQGHSEQVAVSTHKEADSQIPNYPRLPSRLICLLENVTLHAEPETDEVYAQMLLLPIQNPEKESLSAPDLGVPNRQPTEYFCKTLTASDTSTHGGFSIPRRAAEKVFPPLDYTQQPPAQELVARDLHDQEWHFRHIYRGQPRRHLLTTGWSVFVSAKRLQAGDSVLFIRDDKGQLLLGIRRANRQQTNLPSSVLSSDTMHIGVLAAASHAAEHTSRFTIFYNPSTQNKIACIYEETSQSSTSSTMLLMMTGNTMQSPSEFVVPLVKYHKAVYNTHVTVGMRFRMVFETEESSVRRYMGTITGVADLDPVRWPKSHWRSLKVNWDESTAGERQKRVSLWEIEPLTTPFLLCPSPFTMRSKRPRGIPGEEDDLELLMRKSHMWQNSSDTLSPLSFGVGGLPMDTSWMRLPQPRVGTAVPSPHYRALAAAALQEFRTGDPAKQLLSQPLQSTQMQFRQQQPQTEPQQLMLQMNDVPGPLLQLSTSHTQMMDSGLCGRASSYTESDLHIPPSPSSMSGSFSFSGMMGRAQNNSTVNPSDGNEYATMMHTDQSALQPCRTMQGSIQITSAWFPPLQNGLQSDPQSIVSPRLSQVEASSTGVPGSYSVSQNNEPSVQQGLGLPYGFHNHGQESEQMQGDKSHFLFGVPIDQPQVAPAALTSQNFGKPKDAPDSNILLGFCPPATPDSINNGLISNDSLDENVLFHRSPGWPAMQTAAPQRTYIKVHRTGVPGRSLDVRNFSNYTELRKELAQRFNLENVLEDPEKSGWQIVFVDTENDTLLLGDDPWEEFVTYVRSIKILSPHEVAQMNQDQLEMLNAVPTQQHQRPSTSNSEEAHPHSSLPNPSSGTLDI